MASRKLAQSRASHLPVPLRHLDLQSTRSAYTTLFRSRRPVAVTSVASPVCTDSLTRPSQAGSKSCLASPCAAQVPRPAVKACRACSAKCTPSSCRCDVGGIACLHGFLDSTSHGLSQAGSKSCLASPCAAQAPRPAVYAFCLHDALPISSSCRCDVGGIACLHGFLDSTLASWLKVVPRIALCRSGTSTCSQGVPCVFGQVHPVFLSL